MMRKIQNLFNQRLLFRLKIPDYIRQEFLQEGDRFGLTIAFVVA